MILNSAQPRSAFLASGWADRLGIWASALCVVHCLLTPVLLSCSVFFAHLLPGDEVVHRSMAALVACCGAIAVVPGFRQHRQSAVLFGMAAGLCCIFGAAWFGESLPSPRWEIAITMVGSACMIAAHRHNHRSCRACARACCAEAAPLC